MGAATKLIGAQIIGAKQPAILLGDKCLVIRPQPIRDCVLLGHVTGQRIGLACADHRLENAPDTIGVDVGRSTDGCHAI